MVLDSTISSIKKYHKPINDLLLNTEKGRKIYRSKRFKSIENGDREAGYKNAHW